MSKSKENTTHNLFGSSGIRRIVDANMIQLMLETGLSVGSMYRSAIVGCDHRTSNEALKYAFIAGLLSAGCEAYDAGIAPTPTIAYAAKRFGIGAMITASHNPPDYNGVKLINPDGSSFNHAQRTRTEAYITGKSYATTSWKDMKKRIDYSGVIDNHVARILGDFSTGSKLKVAVDCRCGAASTVTPRLLQKLGCEVVCINCTHDGLFQPLEPTPQSLAQLCAMVVDRKADLGIANDGDGDRMVAVDDMGRVLSGDKLMAIFAQQMKINKLVTPVDTSMLVDELGIAVVRTRVGDTYVSEELIETGDFGGEQSGCWIFPSVSYCPDGIYASAKIVDMIKDHRLSDMADAIPYHPIIKGSIATDGISMEKLKSRLARLDHISMDHLDGIRLNIEDGWVLVRPSGTEPKIRITVETKTEVRTEQVYNIIIKTIDSCRTN
jgi:phosphoglucosamine mutase